MFYLIIFLFGLALGSFLNSWIWRTHENIAIRNTRSMCPACRRQLAWYENIPVFSYIFLLGKCRTCKNPIPKHFIFVEVASGIIFVLIAWQYLATAFTPAFFLRNIIFAILLIIIFVYDWLYQEILSEIIFLGIGFGLFFDILFLHDLKGVLVGILVGGGFFLLQFLVSKGKWIGGGDVRMGVMMGVWLGWPLVLVALFLAYILGAIAGVVLLALKKKQLSSVTPFGTYLALATFVVLLWGNKILNWYMSLLR